MTPRQICIGSLTVLKRLFILKQNLKGTKMPVKVDRKELKKPDEMLGFFAKIVGFISEKISYFAFAIVAIILIALVVAGVMSYFESRQRSLEDQLAKPYEVYKNLVLTGREKEGEDLYTPEYLKKRFSALSDEFERIGKKSSNGRAGKKALLFAADSAMRAGNYQKSSDILLALLKSAKDSDEMALFRYKYAELLQARGDFEVAAKQFEEVASNKSAPMRELALFGAASCYQKLERYDAAMKFYEAIVNEYPDSSLLREVSDRLVYVRSKLKSSAKTMGNP